MNFSVVKDSMERRMPKTLRSAAEGASPRRTLTQAAALAGSTDKAAEAAELHQQAEQRVVSLAAETTALGDEARQIQADAEVAVSRAKEAAREQVATLGKQLRQMTKMGGLGALAGMMPGMKKAKAAMAASGADDKMLVHMDAIIGSMTREERKKPGLMNAKRKRRVAIGSGTTVQDVNKLLKMYQEMARAMKRIRKMGGLKGLAAMFGKSGNLEEAMGAIGGPGAGGMPGMGGGGLPPELANLMNKKRK